MQCDRQIDAIGWQVCTQPGWTAQGTQGQKRLILDHAGEMYSQLRSGAGKKLVLEAGFGPEDGEEGEITVCKVGEIAVCKVGEHRATPIGGGDAAGATGFGSHGGLMLLELLRPLFLAGLVVCH